MSTHLEPVTVIVGWSLFWCAFGLGLIGLAVWQELRERHTEWARREQERMRLWRGLGEGKPA